MRGANPGSYMTDCTSLTLKKRRFYTRDMSKSPKKPTEFERFEALTKRLVGVDKREIEQKEKERKVRRRKPKADSG